MAEAKMAIANFEAEATETDSLLALEERIRRTVDLVQRRRAPNANTPSRNATRRLARSTRRFRHWKPPLRSAIKPSKNATWRAMRPAKWPPR